MLTRQEEILRDHLIQAARTNDFSTVTDTIRDIISQLGERATVVVNAADQTGDTALIYAASGGHTVALQILLLVPGIQVDTANEFGYTALTCAAIGGHTVALQILLEAGTNVNLAAPYFGNTPLIVAVMLHNIDIIHALLKFGANVNATNQFGDTALIVAARRGHKAAVEVLLAAPDINLFAQNDGDFNAAEIAKDSNHMELYELITKKALQIKLVVEKHTRQNHAATLIQRCYKKHLLFKQSKKHCRDNAVWQPRPSLAELAGMNDQAMIDEGKTNPLDMILWSQTIGHVQRFMCTYENPPRVLVMTTDGRYVDPSRDVCALSDNSYNNSDISQTRKTC